MRQLGGLFVAATMICLLVLFTKGRAAALVHSQQETSTPTSSAAADSTTIIGLEASATITAPSPPLSSFSLITTSFTTFLLPSTWVDTLSGLDSEEGTFSFTAAPDLTAFEDLTGDQGVIVLVQAADQWVDPVEVLDGFQLPSEDCVSDSRVETGHSFAGLAYEGLYDEWHTCPGKDISLYVLVVQSEEIDAAIFAIFFAPTEISATVFNIFYNTLSITTPPPFERPIRPATPPEQATPIPTPTESLTPSVLDASNLNDDVAVVITDRLNIRSGPGTNYDRVSAVEREDELTILGRNQDCSWLNITTPDGITGWVAAGAQLILFGAECASLSELEAPPIPPTSTPLPTPTPLPTATPAPSPSPTPTSSASASLFDPEDDPNMGCYLFENQSNDEVTITFTRRNGPWNTTFRLPKGAVEDRCFEPGDYTYTLDAPPPWNAVNGELRVGAGDRERFPIQSE